MSIHRAIPGTNAHLIQSDDEAVLIAQELAADFALEASDRDRKRRLPYQEIERFSQSGLWGISVPKAYGGADVSAATLARVVAIISAADPSIGQIPQNHYFFLQLIRTNGSDQQKHFYYDRVLQGERFGNALSEVGTKTVGEYNTRVAHENGTFLVTGRKFYSTGALFAHWIPVVARDDRDYLVAAFVDRGSPGLEIVDDWDSFGQRTTGSGTVILENVRVPGLGVLPYQSAFDEPTALGPVAQIIHAAVEAGIARTAIEETIKFVRERTRPWIDAKIDHGYEDPLIINQIGDLEIRLHAAEALLECAGSYVDRAVAEPDAENVASASIAVAEAKVATTEIALHATNKLFELAGTHSTLAKFNLDRHWRNARTHTLHDPVRWKYFAVGNYYLNDVRPKRTGAL
jgi:SfnB family sulfur acquisition oxidoreductase